MAAGRGGGGLARFWRPGPANPRPPGLSHKSAGSRRGRGSSCPQSSPARLGVGSPAGPFLPPGYPRDRAGSPPRCCFGTRSRSTTTNTRPAATCGESPPAPGSGRTRACPAPSARCWVRVAVSSGHRAPKLAGLPRWGPSLARLTPSGGYGHFFGAFSFGCLVVVFLFVCFVLNKAELGNDLQFCFTVILTVSLFSRACVAQFERRRCDSGKALSEVRGKHLLANQQGIQFSQDGISFSSFWYVG